MLAACLPTEGHQCRNAEWQVGWKNFWRIFFSPSSSFLIHSLHSSETKETWFGIFLLTVCDVIWINLQFWKELCLNYVTVCEWVFIWTLWSVLNAYLKIMNECVKQKDLNVNFMDIFNFTLVCKLFKVFKVFLKVWLFVDCGWMSILDYSLDYGCLDKSFVRNKFKSNIDCWLDL